MEKRYNMKFKRYITLEEGEQFCPKCKGKGKVRQTQLVSITSMLRCDKCNGDGKIDWIEKVTGKKVSYIGYGIGANTIK